LTKKFHQQAKENCKHNHNIATKSQVLAASNFTIKIICLWKQILALLILQQVIHTAKFDAPMKQKGRTGVK